MQIKGFIIIFEFKAEVFLRSQAVGSGDWMANKKPCVFVQSDVTDHPGKSRQLTNGLDVFNYYLEQDL